MRIAIGLLFIFSLPRGWASSSESRFEAQIFDRFTNQLELMLPSGPRVRELQDHATEWMRGTAELIRQDSETFRISPDISWTQAHERDYVRHAEALADRIVESLGEIQRSPERADDELRRVIRTIARNYALIGTFRGNRSTQWLIGSIMGAAVATSCVLSLAVVGPGIAAELGAFAPDEKYARMVELMHLTRGVGFSLIIPGYLGAQATRRGRDFFRRFMILEQDRGAGANRIEAAFWGRVKDGVSKNPELRMFSPGSATSEFRPFFISRLPWTGDTTASCSEWLTEVPSTAAASSSTSI